MSIERQQPRHSPEPGEDPIAAAVSSLLHEDMSMYRPEAVKPRPENHIDRIDYAELRAKLLGWMANRKP
jgi:hypothetical protein